MSWRLPRKSSAGSSTSKVAVGGTEIWKGSESRGTGIAMANTGERLSMDAADGAWISEYEVMPEGEAIGRGAASHGSGTTPTLMGFGEDEDQLVVNVGDVTFEMNHCLGETDDHTWTWIPEHKMITAGDQFIWMFPNCGNPQKVQRYPLEWAQSLRAMAAKDAELFVPSHGLPIAGVWLPDKGALTDAPTVVSVGP